MAQHGGRTVPRAHRPRAPTMSAPLTAPLAPLRPVPAPSSPPPTATATSTAAAAAAAAAVVHVTLQAPRPDAERAVNEYVETPIRTAAAAGGAVGAGAPVAKPALLATTTLARHERALRPPPAPRHHLALPLAAAAATATVAPAATAVTKQPVAFTKEQPATTVAGVRCPGLVGGGLAGGGGGGGGPIMCAACGRCRCEACRAPRALPSRWLCDNACLCSADAVIDYASCLCCVKGLYYHCADSEAGDAGATCADEPCSCAPHRRTARWACLGALAAALPCLLCYWPLRACQRAVEAAYARHSRAGCRCRPHHPTPEKRLLDTSPDF